MLVPLNDRVIVKRSEAETQTKSGLILPSSSQEKPNKGEVIATASEHVSKGDIVFFSSYSGSTVNYEENEYLILKSDELLGKISQ
ncbi:MAG: co-chaperone GroES [Myxococcota bacterium]|jgi:chaperonin GroES|nr:co-chaperone GroES [Myxococcota bacterium]MEC8380463.1 co-chaperone GroES [Myxococcota bacterium]